MKKLLYLSLASFLLLNACGNEDDTKDKKDNASKEQATQKDKKSKADDTKKQKDDANQSKETNDTEANNNENNENSSPNNEEITQVSNETPVQIDINNITDRATLERVLYGQYFSEDDKILAYNNAVANGIIPQGNVLEGPATAAYESSLRVESGTESSIYDKNQTEDTEYEDVNAKINAAETEEEYYNALREKYNGGLSSAELQTKFAIEQGYYDGDDADEVYNKILEEEEKIENGVYDQYKN
ncbi:hypothetical protein [Staphylococcus auricularis]|uniref:hypothetical protein n=1 Tax=Staphylococcus auricularis TaxID=29379 RepID=UPI00242FB8F8|nr:hypothetical protein [Staphylococcus auricularis]